MTCILIVNWTRVHKSRKTNQETPVVDVEQSLSVSLLSSQRSMQRSFLEEHSSQHKQRSLLEEQLLAHDERMRWGAPPSAVDQLQDFTEVEMPRWVREERKGGRERRREGVEEVGRWGRDWRERRRERRWKGVRRKVEERRACEREGDEGEREKAGRRIRGDLWKRRTGV